MQHPYFGKTISLTTKHKKASALALPLLAGVGLRVSEVEVDTILRPGLTHKTASLPVLMRPA